MDKVFVSYSIRAIADDLLHIHCTAFRLGGKNSLQSKERGLWGFKLHHVHLNLKKIQIQFLYYFK